MDVQIQGISFVYTNQTIIARIKVDAELEFNVSIPFPEGDQDNLTVGLIKKLAIEAAGSKIPHG